MVKDYNTLSVCLQEKPLNKVDPIGSLLRWKIDTKIKRLCWSKIMPVVQINKAADRHVSEERSDKIKRMTGKGPHGRN